MPILTLLINLILNLLTEESYGDHSSTNRQSKVDGETGTKVWMPPLSNQASSEHNLSRVSAARILQMEHMPLSVSSGKAAGRSLSGIGHGRQALITEVRLNVSF